MYKRQVLAVSIAALTTLNHNLSRRGRGQSASGRKSRYDMLKLMDENTERGGENNRATNSVKRIPGTRTSMYFLSSRLPGTMLSRGPVRRTPRPIQLAVV